MPTLHIKVVPGASRDRIAGRLGDAVKVQVSAAPEGGKANKAVEALLAESLGLKSNQVTVVKGHTQPRKVVQIVGISQEELDARISAAVG